MTDAKLPSPLFACEVQTDWIDYNGHMNDASYARVFSLSVDRLMAAIGLDQDGRARTSLTIYTLTMTIHYLREVHVGEALSVEGRILEHDDKRIRLWLELRRADGELSALNEQVLLCVDQSGDKPRSAPFLPDQILRIRAFHAAQASLPMPKQAGRGISLQKQG
jgi:acyl-CoA thioester hydrolase